MTDLAIIIQGCINNDRLCQEKLYMKFYQSLYALCHRFFDDDQEVVTALNNGMLRVFKNIGQYDNTKSELLTWIYAIVRHEALTVIRNQKTVMVTQELMADMPVEVMTNPFIQTKEQDVYVYLSALTNTTRAVCTLFYIEGYSIKEIATSLDMKEGTVKWHLSDGRKRLQSIFNPNDNRIANAK